MCTTQHVNITILQPISHVAYAYLHVYVNVTAHNLHLDLHVNMRIYMRRLCVNADLWSRDYVHINVRRLLDRQPIE